MANQFVFANWVQTTLADAISSSATTITLSSSANLPSIPGGEYFAIVLNDAATGQIYEIVYATQNLGGGQLQVIRGQENTSARAWNVNDKAYACATAGVLASFLNQSALGNFVELSPPSQQSGSINVSGGVTSGGQGTFAAGVSAGGPITNATSGAFSGDVTALDHISTRAYSNTSLANMPLRVNGSGGVIGIGPSSGLTVKGITASALAIGLAGSANFVAIDNVGDIGAAGSIIGTNVEATNEVTAPTILQNGTQVLDALTSTGGTIAITGSGATRNLEVAATGQVPIYGIITSYIDNPVAITLPDYGTWEVRYELTIEPGSNNFFSSNLTIVEGSVTNLQVTNAGNDQNNIPGGFSAVLICTASGGQTIEVSWGASGSFGSSPTARFTCIRKS